MEKTWQKTSEPRDLHALEEQFIALGDSDWLISRGLLGSQRSSDRLAPTLSWNLGG